MEEIDLEIDAGRLLFGLSRIGYTTSSALCDIIDNSVRANASNIRLLIKKEREDFSDSKRNNIKEYLVIDDGCGMDDSGIQEALKLGSSPSNYEENSLSKFGLGLKSAALSQADNLEVISSSGSGFNKYIINLPAITSSGKYFSYKTDLSDVDNQLILEYLSENKGTIIRLNQIRKNNHPSVKNTVKELNTKLGIIYYYFIKDNGVNIFIGDSAIQAIDPLFADEANINGNLDENTWDGTTVRWIEKPKELTLDDDENIKVNIEITQLPYPPIFKIKGSDEIKDVQIREKYLISAGNYGFYVYRNKRLISWASQLQGIVPYEQEYYSFRGRILIDDTADDFFNIDVKKSTLTLSDEAWNSISDFTKEAKSKSRKSWVNAGKVMLSIINKEPHEISNQIVDEFEQLEQLPGDVLPTESEALERIQTIKDDMEKNVKVMAAMALNDMGIEKSPTDEFTEDEIELAIKGEKNPSLSKIFRVTSVTDNLLWEPYYDTDLGSCVRINKFHRFARLIYEDNSDNQDLQIIFDLLLLQFAEAELYAYKNIGQFKYEDLKKILTEFRRISSEFLANMCRKLENVLPPNYVNSEYD